MKLQKAKAAVIAVIAAAAIALSGTFAWQSISQTAMNEAKFETNPGGRLHDDFSGWEAGGTKDIYVENFGSQNIYARVRLDEYMEIGDDAGKKDITGSRNVTVLSGDRATAPDINTPSTWITHKPGDADAEKSADDSDDEFHDYWTWTMGGKTVYMPTFNKNKDSLSADINGTLEGTGSGTPYDDYVAYTVYNDGDAETAANTADGVRDTTVDRGAFYDADDNNTDEGRTGATDIYGNGGTEGTHFTREEDEKHHAKETIDGTVMTMAEYKAAITADPTKVKTIEAWVYDTDGWAYWSQPIKPNTATGLLLDKIELAEELDQPWYYAINVVGQFCTANDLGRGTSGGFYADDQQEPSNDALALLESIGVQTAAVKGSITVAPTISGNAVNYAVKGAEVDLSGVTVTVPSETGSVVQTVTYTLEGDYASGTSVDASGKLTVANNESASEIKVVVASSHPAYVGLQTVVTLPVQAVTYSVKVTPAGDAVSVDPGSTLAFNAELIRNDFQSVTFTNFNWEIVETPTGTTTAVSPTSGAGSTTLTVDGLETLTSITVKASVPSSYQSAYPGATDGTATVTVGSVEFTVTIKDSESADKTNSAVSMYQYGKATFSYETTSSPTEGITPAGTFKWSSTNTSVATVDESTGEVTALAVGTTQIKVTNDSYSPALEAKFDLTVSAVTFSVDIKDSASTPNTVTNAEVLVAQGANATFTKALSTNPTGYESNLPTAADTWTWSVTTDNASGKITVDNDGKVSVASDATIDNTAVITVSNGSSSTPALSASFTVKVADQIEAIKSAINSITPGSDSTVEIDGITWYVLAKQTAGGHNAALLLSEKVLETRQFDGSSSLWKDSALRTYLNNSSGGWLDDKSVIQSKAIQVSIQTRSAYNSTTSDGGVNDKVFLLSETDVFGDSTRTFEYTAGSQLTLPNSNKAVDGGGSASNWWLRSPRSGASRVAGVGTDGTVNDGNRTLTYGVRPAFWFNLDS